MFSTETSCFPPEPVFSTRPRVFHQNPCFPPEPVFSTPRVFHTPGPRDSGTPGPRPRVFHLACQTCGPYFRIELEFGVLVFVTREKPENPEKNPRSRDENQQQTQPTCDTESGNRTQATAVRGERPHHCAIPCSPGLPLRSIVWSINQSINQSINHGNTSNLLTAGFLISPKKVHQ